MEDPAVLPDPVLADPVLADPVLADPVPADPKVFEPVLAEPVAPDPVLPELVAPDPVLPDPVLPEPVLPDPELGPAAGGVVSAGLLPVPPPAGGLDGGDTAVEELPPAGGVTVAVAWGLAVFDGCAELVAGQGDRVAPALRLPVVALVLAFAEAVEPAPPVALAVPVTVTVTVCVAVAVALSLGLLLVLPLGGLLAELAGGAVGVTDAAAADGLAWAGDDETGGHAVTGTLLWTAELAPWPVPPADPAPWVADPFRLGAPLPALELEIPTAVPSWTKASRSGGTARATPMANTAQAAARAGRSSPYRHSRLPASPACCPPRAAFQRRVRPARKPARAAECRLAWAGPEPIRARIRSSPSGRGSS